MLPTMVPAMREVRYACLGLGSMVLAYLLFVMRGHEPVALRGTAAVATRTVQQCMAATADVNATGTFYSQFGQDAYLAKNVFASAAAAAVYVELGAYHPTRFSNTALFDKCFGWRGLCIDMNPFHKSLFEAQRTCEFVHTCVAQNRTHIDYYPTDNELGDGKEGVSRVACEPFDRLLDRFKIAHIDFLSIDIEGGEMGALRTFPFDRVSVHAILVETWHIGKTDVFDFLEDRGFVHAAELGPDDLFVATGATPWLPAQTAAWRKAIRGARAEFLSTE